MTVYGDLDVSIIDELPAGRSPVVTRVIRQNQLPDAYDFIRKQAEKGRQAFIVYPLVSASDASSLRAATDMYEALREGVFRNLNVGLVHGRLNPSEKSAVMDSFHEGKTDILVATIVVEVGIDISNATVMLIEHAERFGLAQLHQLRGRVGRGAAKSFCILQGDPKSADSWRRLRIMEETTDGFRIAEEDLEIRGMGNLLGREQSGMPVLRVGHPIADAELLRIARKEALAIASADPRLQSPAHRGLRERAKAMYREAGALLGVG
jgi:ATP-dependent DNA helicase RecG